MPYHGARPMTTEVDRPVDVGLGATLGWDRAEFRLSGQIGPEFTSGNSKFDKKRRYRRHHEREPRRNEGHHRGDLGL